MAGDNSVALLYDNLTCAGAKTTLGASLTAGATSITFAGALQQYGSNIPTLTGNQFIPLTLSPVGDPASTSTAERVWLTAYTAGATTGTIIRGEEGSTGVTHSNGEPFVLSAAARTISQLKPVSKIFMSDFDTGGGDSTSDIQNAINAAYDLASATYGRVQIVMDSRQTYTLGNAPTTSGSGHNSQLHIPAHSTQVVWIEMVGMPAGSFSVGPNGPEGTIIQSTVSSATYSAANGIASMIGGPASYKTTPNTFTWVNFSVRDIVFRQPTQPQLVCLDLGWVLSCSLENVQCDTTQWANGTANASIALPTNAQSMGIQFPFVNMDPPSSAENVSVSGYFTAYGAGELLRAGFMRAGWCQLVFACDVCFHPNYIAQLLDINCIYGFAALDPSSGVIAIPSGTGKGSGASLSNASPSAFVIGHWDMQDNNGETTGFNRVSSILDTGTPKLYIIANYSRVLAGTGQANGLILSSTSAGTKGRLVDVLNGGDGRAGPLAIVTYDPGGVTTQSSTSTTFAATDTTNLRATFVAPASGIVVVKFGGFVTFGTGAINPTLGVLDGSTVKAVCSGSASANQFISSSKRVTGLTPGTTYNWDLALASASGGVSVSLKYGGGEVAGSFGAAFIEVWAAE